MHSRWFFQCLEEYPASDRTDVKVHFALLQILLHTR